MTHSLQAALEKRRKSGNLRALKVFQGADFCSNDYLGLARFPIKAGALGSGSTGSRLIAGHAPAVEHLEERIAAFHGFEAALLFSSGYAANTGLLSCIAGPEDAILSDDLIHASLIDGIRLSRAHRQRFAHNDLQDLRAKLDALRSKIDGQIYVVVEAIYSMDGDKAPLQDICDLCQSYNASLIVDEAHSIGIHGVEGRGLVSELGLEAQVFAAIYTFGKAAGFHGAMVVGAAVLRDYLVNFCRPFIYTTAPSPQTVAETGVVYDRLRAADPERGALRSVLSYFATHVKNQTLDGAHWLDSDSPIQGLVVSGNERAKACAAFLQEHDLAVKAILSPTVAEGTERLRLSLHSFNTQAEMDGLATRLSEFLNGGRS